jgi:hypothetical protein
VVWRCQYSVIRLDWSFVRPPLRRKAARSALSKIARLARERALKNGRSLEVVPQRIVHGKVDYALLRGSAIAASLFWSAASAIAPLPAASFSRRS